MELYGIATLCKLLQKPLYAIKYVVNDVDEHNGRSELRKNLEKPNETSIVLLEQLIDSLLPLCDKEGK